MRTDWEFYWSAGFLEGEGSFTVNKSGPSAQITCGQNSPEPLYMLQQALGGSVTGPYQYNRPDGVPRNPFWRWNLCGPSAIQMMKELYPYMSARRQDQIDTVMFSCLKVKGVSHA